MGIVLDSAGSKVILNNQIYLEVATTITTDKSASTLAIDINASSPLSASGTNLVLMSSGVTAGTYQLSSYYC